MPEKLLVQSQGSKRDPAYKEQKLELEGEQVSFHEFFHRQGIETLKDDLVNSCHGNTDLTLNLVSDIRALADEGHRIVSIEQGGLYFAKPSLEAANMPTVPVISVPLGSGIGGVAAFLAPYVPPGTAAIAGVSMANYQTAATVAAKILNNRYEGVYLSNRSETSKKLEETLEELKVPVLGDCNDSYMEDSLVLGRVHLKYDPIYTEFLAMDKRANVVGGKYLGVFAPIGDSVEDSNLIKRLHHHCSQLKTSVMVNRDENLAYFAAKIMAAYNNDIAKQLTIKAGKKAESYDKREIVLDSFSGGK